MLLEISDISRASFYYPISQQTVPDKYQNATGLQQSILHKGNCLGNGVIENLFGLLKSELPYLPSCNVMLKQLVISAITITEVLKARWKGLPPALHRHKPFQQFNNIMV